MPDEEGMANDTDAYEEDDEEEKESEQEDDNDAAADPEPTPEPQQKVMTRSLRKLRRRSRSFSARKALKKRRAFSEPPPFRARAESLESLESLRSPPPKLPRSMTEMSYEEPVSASQAEELDKLMAQLYDAEAKKRQSENLDCT